MKRIIPAFLLLAFMMAGGMPFAHGVSGRDFGRAVSNAAQSSPGAIADHVRS